MKSLMTPKKTKMNVNVDIITADMHNTEYEEVEKRMIKTNLKGKNNVATPIEYPNTVTGNYHQYSTSMMHF